MSRKIKSVPLSVDELCVMFERLQDVGHLREREHRSACNRDRGQSYSAARRSARRIRRQRPARSGRPETQMSPAELKAARLLAVVAASAIGLSMGTTALSQFQSALAACSWARLLDVRSLMHQLRRQAHRQS
jgi:hypothetical protein